MASYGATAINLQLNTEEALVGTSELSEVLKELKTIAGNVGATITKAFAPVIDSVRKIQLGVDDVNESVSKLVTSLTEVKMSTKTSPDTGGLLVSLTEGYDGIIEILKKYEEVEKYSQKLQTIFERVVAAPNLMEGFQSLFPNLAGLFGSVGAVLGKFAGAIGTAFSTVGTWVTGTLVPAITNGLGLIASALGISVGWVVAIIAAVIAAIVAVVVYWDEIKLFFTQTLPQLWEQFVQWISGIAGAVGEFFSGAMAAIGGFFADCWNGVVAVWNGAAQWMQDNVIAPIIAFFTPIVEWFAALFSSIWQTVSDVFYNIGVIISGCWEIIKAVWAIVGSWFNDNVIQPVVGFFTGLWTSISTFAVQAWESIKSAFSAVGNWFYQNVIQPVAGFFSGLWSGFLNAASAAWDGVKGVFSVVGKFFGDIFSKAWQGVVKVFSAAGNIFVDIKDAIVGVFKTVVNGIIKGLNSVIAVPFNGINSALKLVKNIEILGLQPFSGLKTISVPQIPLLAQGAVLPANKPFLAMVGDQRHGTNIEAPLATIQEAVALVMEDQTAAILSGFEASVGVQRAILEAVLGIQIGDEVIGQAVARYNRKLAVMRGGV